MFIRLLFSHPRSFAAITLLVVFSICLHEYMHALVALKMGDSTAADRGHLTMSPFRQMGWWSLVMLAFFGIAWGQVPVDVRNLPSRRSRIAVALAGVGANLFLALVFAILSVAAFLHHRSFAGNMLYQGAVMNLIMLIINLIPVPGLDGFRVLIEFISFKPWMNSEKISAFFFFLMMLVFFGIDYIAAAAEYAVSNFMDLLLQVRL